MFTSLGNTIPRSWLVWEWLLDWSASDTSWNWNNGTATNLTWWTNWNIGYQKWYASFSWSGSWIDITQWDFWNSFTYSIYFKTTQSWSFWFLIECNNNSSFANRHAVEINSVNWWLVNWQLEFFWNDWVSFWRISPTVNPNINDWKWHHLVWSRDWTNNDNKIYIDNKEIAFTSYNWWIPSWDMTSWFLDLGKVWDNRADLRYIWQANLFRLYNRVLSQEEIRLLYLEGNKLLWPTSEAKYPKLFEWLVWYFDMRWTAHNLVDWVTWTVSWATLTTDRFWYSNSSYLFAWWTDKITIWSSSPILWTWDYSISFYTNITSNPTSWNIKWLLAFASTWTSAILHTQIDYHNNAWTVWVRVLISNSSGSYVNIRADWDLTSAWWNMFTLSVIWTSVVLYKNWVSVASWTFSWTRVSDNTANKFIWTDYNSTAWVSLIGKIWEVIIKNKWFTSDEASLLYKLTSQDYIYPTPSYDLSNLRDWLVLDLNEQWQDLSWNWNHWTLVWSPTVVRQWKAKGLSYNGSNQYTSVPNSASLSLQTLTISMFIKLNWTSTLEQNPIRKDTVTTRHLRGFTISANSRNLSAQMYNWTNYLSTSYTLTDWIWTHIAMTISWSWWIMKFYVNWNKIWWDISLWTFTAPSSILWIWATIENWVWPNFANHFKWQIFNPRIWSRVLSAKEIEQLYYSTKWNFIY